MIRHAVMFRWNDGTPSAHVDAAGAALDALPAAIPELRAYRHGPDLGLGSGNFDYAVTADVADAAGLATYREHPQHQAFIADFLEGHVAERVAVQFEFES